MQTAPSLSLLPATALLALLTVGAARAGVPLDQHNSQTSIEQGQTPLWDSFRMSREERLKYRAEAIKDTEFKFNFRTYYFDREKQDNTESEAWAIGGWAGVKSGYFLDHFAFGVTGYTSQKLVGEKEKDGTSILAPGQKSYTVLGEAYMDIRIIDDLNILVGRKEFDSPFINRDDTRMTPNTFESALLIGNSKLGDIDGELKYGGGYFTQIKERNSSDFISMSEAAGASVERGVATVGALYKNDNYSIGAIDYLSVDIINILYAEATLKLPITAEWQPKLSLQFTDQRSVGDNLLTGSAFSGQQIGFKIDLPVKKALFTFAYTYNTDGTDQLSPWSGYPGYAAVQVQDFNRAGEGAFLVRGSYDLSHVPGLSAYLLTVFGTDPAGSTVYRQNEYNANLQWAPPEGCLKGLSLRLRYGLVQQFGGGADRIEDFRVIGNYAFKF